jgi:hypothetical protein
VSFSHTNLWLLAFSIEAIDLRADCPLLADSVEKVGHPKLPDHRPVKTPFLHAATDTSAESKDFNVGRVLFSCGNHGRLFQQNRPISAVFQ